MGRGRGGSSGRRWSTEVQVALIGAGAVLAAAVITGVFALMS